MPPRTIEGDGLKRYLSELREMTEQDEGENIQAINDVVPDSAIMHLAFER